MAVNGSMGNRLENCAALTHKNNNDVNASLAPSAITASCAELANRKYDNTSVTFHSSRGDPSTAAADQGDMIANMRSVDINSNDGEPLIQIKVKKRAGSVDRVGFITRLRHTFGNTGGSAAGRMGNQHACANNASSATFKRLKQANTTRNSGGKRETMAILSQHKGSVQHQICPARGYGAINGELPRADDNGNDDDDYDDDGNRSDSSSELDYMNWEEDNLSDILYNSDESEYIPQFSDTESEAEADDSSGESRDTMTSANSVTRQQGAKHGGNKYCSSVTKPRFLRRVLNYFFSATPTTPQNTPRPTPGQTPGTTPLHSHHASTQEMHSRLEHYANR